MFSDIFGTFTLHLVDIGFTLLLLIKNRLFLKKYIWQKDYFTQFFVAVWQFIGIKDKFSLQDRRWFSQHGTMRSHSEIVWNLRAWAWIQNFAADCIAIVSEPKQPWTKTTLNRYRLQNYQLWRGQWGGDYYRMSRFGDQSGVAWQYMY